MLNWWAADYPLCFYYQDEQGKGSGGGKKQLNVKDQNKLYFEKELQFTRGLNAAQQSHKHSQETVLTLVKVTHQGVQTTSAWFKCPCRYPINLCFDIPLCTNQQIQSCILLPNPKTPRLVTPCLCFFP